MGYYAQITDHNLRITNLDRATKLLNDEGFPGDDFVDCLINWGYDDIEIDMNGNVNTLVFDGKYRSDDELWRTLAKVITSTGPDLPYIEWRGEDNELWRFVFDNGVMKDHTCDIVWSYTGQRRRPAPAVVEPLTLEGRAKQLLAEAITRHIEHHIALDGQYAPLVRECQMTLKSVQDADKVILNLEVANE